MKRLAIVSLLAAAAFCLAGCVSLASFQKQVALINSVLDAELPVGYTGNVHLDDKNPYFQFTLDATGLHKDAAGWHWDGINFHYDGRFSSGNYVRTPTPPK